jgi:hypothetical protein
MKVRPKEVLLNLPVALLFDEPWEVASFAANINAILHGKVRLKAEELGTLGGRYVGLFYLQRNLESQQIHDEFMRLIQDEEVGGRELAPLEDDEDEIDTEEFRGVVHHLCDGADCPFADYHVKGLDHCWCGGEFVNGKCESQNG